MRIYSTIILISALFFSGCSGTSKNPTTIIKQNSKTDQTSLPQLLQTDPSDWPNAYTAPDGTIWSDNISGSVWNDSSPGLFLNCISNTYSQGGPPESCQYDADGILLGTSLDQRTVLDSNAVRACKTIGGELPSEQDFKNLGNHWVDLPNSQGMVYWTSLSHPASDWYLSPDFPKPLPNLAIIGEQYFCENSLPALKFADVARDHYASVRCVSHPAKN
jgi:hypothetical protein